MPAPGQRCTVVGCEQWVPLDSVQCHADMHFALSVHAATNGPGLSAPKAAQPGVQLARGKPKPQRPQRKPSTLRDFFAGK